MVRTLRPLACSLVIALAMATTASAWSTRVEQAVTRDGVTLRLLHLENRGGVPCLLVHGIGANLFEFVVPGRSFAGFLADHGYDVWCLDLRHAGRGRVQSDGAGDHDFDDLVVQDVPAAVDAVRAATGQRPFLLGHSLGGMVELAWLQGTTRASVPVDRRLTLHGLEVVRGQRIVADPALAARRAASIRGLVALASPARFRWPVSPSPSPTHGPLYWDANVLLEYLSWSPAANAASLLTPVVPAERVVDAITDDLTRFPFVGPAILPYLRRVTAEVGRTYLLAELMVPGSVDGRVLYDGLDFAVDDVPVGILQQFMDGIRTGDMREHHVLDRLHRAYSYADGERLVQAPLLWVSGRCDKLANDDAIAATFATVGSPDKTLLSTGHGHIDLVIGDSAPQDVWAPVLGWLNAR